MNSKALYSLQDLKNTHKTLLRFCSISAPVALRTVFQIPHLDGVL